MAKFELKGFNHKVGTFKERPYDNYQLFGVTDKKEWKMFKIKNTIIQDAGIRDMNALIGNTLEIYYDEYGNIDTLRVG